MFWFMMGVAAGLILLTSAGIGLYYAGIREGRQVERIVRAAVMMPRLTEAMAQVRPLPRAGYLPGPPYAAPDWQGRADRSQQLQGPFDLPGTLGHIRRLADWEEAEREVAAIIREVEANPDMWRYR